jgi:hypothetical protein
MEFIAGEFGAWAPYGAGVSILAYGIALFIDLVLIELGAITIQ